jgi:glyoxylase-like metal-dependent hydrolase (beta-lactamase superfamily II)
MIRPVAHGSWFSIAECGDGISHIWEPYVVEKTRCNIWHVKGRERDLIIDSGMGLASLAQFTGTAPGKPVLAVATHTHFDHVGGHHEFAERAVHRAEAEILSKPSRRNTVIDVCVTEHTFHAYPNDRFDPNNYDIAPAPPTMVLDGGEILDLGNRRFEVLHYPGHSPGSIALWESETGVLFSGDVVYDGELSDKLYHSDPGEYERSLARLREIPVKMVHGGHHASFDHQRFIEIIESYLQRDPRQSAKHHDLSK